MAADTWSHDSLLHFLPFAQKREKMEKRVFQMSINCPEKEKKNTRNTKLD